MRFAFPEGFWLGAAGALVLLTHLVRQRARRQVVPFLPIWAAVVSSRRGGFGAAIVRHLDLALVLAACAAVAVAAGGPFVPGRPDTVRDLVLVLDGGVALGAGGRATRLRKVAEAEIQRRAPGTRFVIVRVRDRGPLLERADREDGALRAVASHQPGWTAADPTTALALAREAGASLRDADLVFVTYRPGRPEGFRLRTVIEPVRNAGVTALEVVGDPESGDRIVRVRVRGRGPASIDDLWSGELDGETTLDLPLPAAGRVEWRLAAEGDGFAPDGEIRLLLPERELPRVLVVAAGTPSPFLVAALTALEEVGAVRRPVDRTTPDRAEEAASSYDVLVFDRCAPPEHTPRMRALYLAPPPSALPFEVGEEQDAPAFVEVTREHPLLKGIDLARIPPRRARALFGGEVLASAAPGPVLCVAPAWIALGVDPDRCVLASSPAYPLFLRNAIAHLARPAPRDRPEFRRVGEPAPMAGAWTVAGRGRVRVEDRLIGPPGFWKSGDTELAVNLVAPDLDLSPATEPSDPLPDVGIPSTPDRPLAAPFAAAALVALLLAWWIFWRER